MLHLALLAVTLATVGGTPQPQAPPKPPTGPRRETASWAPEAGPGIGTADQDLAASSEWRAADLAWKSGDWDSALAEATKAVGRYPDRSLPRLLVGLAYEALKRPDDALAAYQKAVKANPPNAVAWCRLGWAFSNGLGNSGPWQSKDSLSRGPRKNEALAAYGHALKLDPGYSECWFFLGESYNRWGDYAGAESAYGEAARLAPGSFLAWRGLLRSYTYLGQQAKIPPLLEQLRESDSSLAGKLYDALSGEFGEEVVRPKQRSLASLASHTQVRTSRPIVMVGVPQPPTPPSGSAGGSLTPEGQAALDFETHIASLAKQALELGPMIRRYDEVCERGAAGSSTATADQGPEAVAVAQVDWTAVWAHVATWSSATMDDASPACRNLASDITVFATQIRDAVDALRHANLEAGVLRAEELRILRKYGMSGAEGTQ
jgi:tetratricopeptide (TPR) repeat protein